MEIEARQRIPLFIGAVIGALLGAGAAFLLTQEVADPEVEKEPIKAKDVLDLTNDLVRALRGVDEVRRRL